MECRNKSSMMWHRLVNESTRRGPPATDDCCVKSDTTLTLIDAVVEFFASKIDAIRDARRRSFGNEQLLTFPAEEVYGEI
jgi:hypothetical protein